MTTKICTTCSEEKELDEFDKQKGGKYGKAARCKTCSKEYHAQQYVDNCDYIRLQQVIYYENNRDAHSVRTKQWIVNNPDKSRSIHKKADKKAHQLRRARLKGIPGTYHIDDWKFVCEHYEYHCLDCGEVFPFELLEMDHVIPLFDTKNSSNSIENFQPLCRSCNSSKKTKDTDYRLDWVDLGYPLIEWIA